MPEVRETSVAEITAQPHNQPKAEARGAAADAIVLTNENFEAHVDKLLGKEETPAHAAAESPEAKAAEELKRVEKEKAERIAKEKGEEIDHPDKKKKGELNERFSELTKARKEAEAKAQAETEARTAAEQKAEQAAREAAELRAKYEPPKSDDIGPEPQPDQFADAREYGKALKDWTAESVRIEDAKKARVEQQTREQETRAREFKAREEAVRKEVPDYDKKLAEATVTLSDQMASEVRGSDVGPQILLHFAEHPEVAAEMGKMTIAGMLKAFGRLEATLQKTQAKAPAGEKVVPIRREAEISQAPAPISPLSGGGEAPLRLSGSQEVPKNMSYEDWKAARKAGRIK